MDADTLSEEFANSVLPVTILIGILAVFGLVGNSSVIYVYKWKYSKCNFRTFVLCLAMVDFISCLFVFPTEMVGHRIWFSYPKSAAWFCKLKTSIYAIAVFVSSYILLLISIDRFRKVCRPLGWQISQKVALRLCLFIFGLCLILIIPCPILFGIQTSNITYEGENIVITSCGRDDEYKHSVWITIYVAILYYATVITFMVTTMVLYGMILRKLFCGNFLKEIDHTEELKRRSKLKMAELSDDETRDGVFSSDTFLDHSSTFADEHNLKDEPKLIKIESGERLCIEYTDKDGNVRTETIQYTNNSHEDVDENPRPISSTRESAVSDITTLTIGQGSDATRPHCNNSSVCLSECDDLNPGLDKGIIDSMEMLNESNSIVTGRIIAMDTLKGVINKAYIPDLEKGSNSSKSKVSKMQSTDMTTNVCEEYDTDHGKTKLPQSESSDKETATCKGLENEAKNQDAPDTAIIDSVNKTSKDLQTTKLCDSTEDVSEERNDNKTDEHPDEFNLNVQNLAQVLQGESAGKYLKGTVHFDKPIIEQVNGASIDTTMDNTLKKNKVREKHELKHKNAKQRIRNKSVIMFVVTLIFNITTLIYFCIFTVVIRKEHIFEIVTPKSTGVLFFFWRVYFLNHVINPVVYGSLDPRFRKVLKKSWRKIRRKQSKRKLSLRT